MTKRMTCVFDCDVRSIKGNPFHLETPFGRPIIIDDGNLAVECEQLREALEAWDFCRSSVTVDRHDTEGANRLIKAVDLTYRALGSDSAPIDQSSPEGPKNG